MTKSADNKHPARETITSKLSAWFSDLSQSEQRLLTVGGLLVGMALGWVLVYQPVVNHIDAQVSVKARLQNQLNQMQAMTGTTVNNSVTEVLPIPAGVTFSSWVDQQLRLVNLQEMVNRTEPIDENSLSVWLQGAPFDQVIDWLQTISTQYAVQVDQIDVNVVDATLGLTNIRMRLVK
jgi:general secretion pathway protein M